MSGFIDFDEIKKSVSLAQAADMLGLQVKANGAQLRGACPSCKKGGDRSLVITDGKGAFCFSAHKGGDVIWLVSHIRATSVKEAAQFLADTLSRPAKTVPTVPQGEERHEGGKNLQPLSYLEHGHDAVLALGFDADVAAKLGIGYAPKGLMRGTVAVPIRDEHGAIQGYIGLEDPPRLPVDFTTNVVPFTKKTA